MTGSTLTPIDQSSVVTAWLGAVEAALTVPAHAAPPLAVTVRGGEASLPTEPDAVVRLVDRFLASESIRRKTFVASVDQSAMTIFPHSSWVRRGKPDASEFCKLCVDRLYPRMKRCNSLNKYGTYFQRLMGYPVHGEKGAKAIGQVQHVIKLMSNMRFKESSLQMPIFHPGLDHTEQRQRGFPCLQQVGVSWIGDAFALNAFYPTQSLIYRGLGNYIGLSHLGLFMAHQAKREFVQLNIFVGSPTISHARRSDAGALVAGVKRLLASDGDTVESEEMPCE